MLTFMHATFQPEYNAASVESVYIPDTRVLTNPAERL
jgi:hypothetical protein